ncbi:hypothetical protein SAMN04488510_11415 [Fervidobacterium changbaicum]|uniref:Uncharacterized protein n=1 Tax=Fervidobacterium changbaicum TaxID=310769 RepID=A0ABX5QQY2_9BACT|nr:hypothetical protein [Fervidobacterium changbaicum]QAV32653.1 hypothetical protein CBS1_02070 [Fervidobacterium changbaicum]SDH42846.1 hypothetical protein SAMN04488510_11415 [Fervidobacterium changbaicum]
MRSLNKILGLELFLSLLTFLMYIIRGDFIFSLVIFSFTLIFLTAFREFGSTSYSFRIAHLYVGSVLFTIAAGYVLLGYLISFVNLLFGERPNELSLSDIILLITGAYSLFNVFYLRKVGLKPGNKAVRNY